jgi:N-acyl-L-homoserine lactone synthetase
MYIEQIEGKQKCLPIFHLRYEIYCVEKQWLSPQDYPEQLETDSLDDQAVHFSAKNDRGEIVGGCRLLLKSRMKKELPISHHPGMYKKTIREKNSAEVSRLVVRPEYRNGLISSGLYLLTYQYCLKQGISCIYLVVEQPLIRRIHALGIPFELVGEKLFYFGDWTVPVRIDVLYFKNQVIKEQTFLGKKEIINNLKLSLL